WKGIEGSTIKRLYNRHILNTIINLPLYEEQEKIGTFFSKLDHQIELEEEKLELLEQQKRGYMQKIFSQELRFKDENGNAYPKWKEIKLKEILEVSKRKNTDNNYDHNDVL
ncbi:restriction endonuclease subunit S, partial [Staphylococcus hominis]|nr:restriction endonuclease subunit S [Staphylococcus hominis]